MDNTKYVSSGFSIESLGIITWIVFLVLKLCNQGNPNFNWLTWFWVWFPLWIPIAVELVIVLIILIVILIIDRRC